MFATSDEAVTDPARRGGVKQPSKPGRHPRGNEMPALSRLQRLLDHEPSGIISVAGVVLCVSLPTAMRWALHPVLGDALWFATYFPAILGAALCSDGGLDW